MSIFRELKVEHGEHLSICRDDNCDIVEVHFEHDVAPKKAERAPTGESELWRRPSSKALDRSIASATSRYQVTHFGAILRHVENDYGSGASPHALERAVYRHLAKLVARGQIIKLDLGLAFAAYLRPKSKLLNDLDFVKEALSSQFDTEGPGNAMRRERESRARRRRAEATPDLQACA